MSIISADGPDYHDYLRSPEWHRLARQTGRLAGRCGSCGRAAKLAAHHVTYRRLGRRGEERDLVALCASCHPQAHRRARQVPAPSLAEFHHWLTLTYGPDWTSEQVDYADAWIEYRHGARPLF